MNLHRSLWLIAGSLWLVLTGTASAQPLDRPQQAVRVMTHEVARRVFGALAQEKAPGTTQPAYLAAPAKRIADSLQKNPDADALAVIAAIDKKPDLKGASDKLTELARFVPENTKPDNEVLAVLKSRLTIWRKKYQKDSKAYEYGTIQEEAVMQAVGAWLQQHPAATDDGLTGMVDTTSAGAGLNDSAPTSVTGSTGTKQTTNSLWMNLFWFLVGALLAMGAGIWFWLRPRQQLTQDWKTVSDLARNLNLPLSPANPAAGPVSVTQLTNLIETLHKRAGADGQKARSDVLKTNVDTQSNRYDDRQNRDLITQLRVELGNGDLLEAVRGLKAEVQRLPAEPEPAAVIIPTTTTTKPALVVSQAGGTGQATRPQSVVVYFSQPDPDGWFDDSQRTAQPTSDTCYRFMLGNAGATSATFNFEASPERVPRFLNFRNFFIDPACEPQNNFQPGHSRVITLRDGKARLTNGQWRVETKAQIRFE